MALFFSQKSHITNILSFNYNFTNVSVEAIIRQRLFFKQKILKTKNQNKCHYSFCKHLPSWSFNLWLSMVNFLPDQDRLVLELCRSPDVHCLRSVRWRLQSRGTAVPGHLRQARQITADLRQNFRKTDI
jgi:hypothetical protein